MIGHVAEDVMSWRFENSRLLLGCRMLTLVVAATMADHAAAAEPKDLGPGKLSPEALKLSVGRPLGAFALVPQPMPIPGVLAWTIETRRHRGDLTAMDTSPDGRLVALGGDDTTIRIWELDSGKLVRTLVGHDRDIRALSWSPDGGTIASTGGTDRTVRLWNASTSMPLRVFKGFKDDTELVQWSADGSVLAAAGGASGWIWLWRSDTQQGGQLTEMGEEVLAIDWSPDGRSLAVATRNKAVSIIDVESGKATAKFGDDQNSPYFARWSPDGTRLAVGTHADASVYEMPSGKRLWNIAERGFDGCWSPDGTQLVLVLPNEVQVFGVADWKKLQSFSVYEYEMQWLGADRVLVLNDTDLSCWQPSTGKQLFRRQLGGHWPPVYSGNQPLVTGLGTPTLALWDRDSGRKLRSLDGDQATINSVAWARKGDLLAAVADDKTVRVWDAGAGKLLHTLDHKPHDVTAIAWSADSKLLASGTSDAAIRLWDASGKDRGALKGHAKPVAALAWSPRGNLLASGGDDNVVKLWNVAASKADRDIPTSSEVHVLAFSPNGAMLAGGTADAAVQLWQVAGGKKINVDIKYDAEGSGIAALSWSTDGKVLAVGRENAVGQLWDWQANRTVEIFTVGEFRYLTWTPNGNWAISGDKACAVYYWDRSSGKLGGVIVSQDDYVLLVAPNGYYRIDSSVEPDFVFAVQTPEEQLMLTPAEFAVKFRWRNNPSVVKLGKP
jgi:WD40 repeat protein